MKIKKSKEEQVVSISVERLFDKKKFPSGKFVSKECIFHELNPAVLEIRKEARRIAMRIEANYKNENKE